MFSNNPIPLKENSVDVYIRKYYCTKTNSTLENIFYFSQLQTSFLFSEVMLMQSISVIRALMFETLNSRCQKTLILQTRLARILCPGTFHVRRNIFINLENQNMMRQFCKDIISFIPRLLRNLRDM